MAGLNANGHIVSACPAACEIHNRFCLPFYYASRRCQCRYKLSYWTEA
jgi:hypothetical protein